MRRGRETENEARRDLDGKGEENPAGLQVRCSRILRVPSGKWRVLCVFQRERELERGGCIGAERVKDRRSFELYLHDWIESCAVWRWF